MELKARAFEPGVPAQLNFYINVINSTLKTAEYALKGCNQLLLLHITN